MPFIEDWITHPMTIINRLQEKSPSTFENDVRNYFQTHINDPDLYREIPSLNDRHDDTPLPSGCLVRYRAMVQDMGDDEIYCSQYKIRSNDHKVEIEKSSKYMDLFVCPPGYTMVDQEPARESFRSRQSLSCIPIPNETQWVKDHYRRRFGEQMTIQKRSLNDLDNVQQLLSPLKRLKTAAATETGTNNDNEATVKTEPVATKPKSYYLVKVYDTTDEILLNSLVEFIGIYYDHSVVKADSLQAINDMDPDELPQVKTIHCIQYKKLSHINPILHHRSSLELNNIPMLREHVLSLFECIFPNDKLLCEYLLLHLISRIYVRQPTSAYGKLSMNISHISNEQLDALQELLQLILPLHSTLSITVNSLNTTQLMPNKNISNDNENENQLKQTPLQLPLNSQLLIDETKMECGQLTTLGLNNIKLLQDFLRQQTLKYEFHVYQLDYECDVRCLIVSSTKSILPSDIYIRYQSDQEIQDITYPNMTNEQIDNIRCYLTYASQQLNFDQAANNASSDVNTFIQEDFVQMRKEKLITNLDDFHLLLVLARLQALSYGENVLTPTRWSQAKSLEFARRQRMNI